MGDLVMSGLEAFLAAAYDLRWVLAFVAALLVIGLLADRIGAGR
jgi:hypothetical protein